jgi:hypothetical protein
MGAIADSIMATSIILDFDSKSQHTTNKLWLASKLTYSNQVPKPPMLTCFQNAIEDQLNSMLME